MMLFARSFECVNKCSTFTETIFYQTPLRICFQKHMGRGKIAEIDILQKKIRAKIDTNVKLQKGQKKCFH